MPIKNQIGNPTLSVLNVTAQQPRRKRDPFVCNWAEELAVLCNTPKGAEASATAYSLVETANANDEEPFVYLSFVLDELRYLSKTPPAAELDRLLPWAPGILAKFSA